MRKRIFTVLTIVLILVAVAWSIDAVYTYTKTGVRVSPGELQTTQTAWAVVDTTSSDANEPSDLAADERTYATVVSAISTAAATMAGDDDAEISIYEVPVGANAGRFRCAGWTDGGDIVYEIYFGTLSLGGTDCELAKAGQLAFVIGTQASTTTGYELADTVVVTSYCWTKAWSITSPGTGTETVAEAAIDLQGADIVIAVPTTADCNSILLMKGY